MPRLQSRAFRSPAFWVALVSFMVAIAANMNSDVFNRSTGFANEPANGLSSQTLDSSSNGPQLLREDTSLDSLRGQFTLDKGRFVFIEEGSSKPIKCLENLWLQRIADAQKTANKKVIWNIDVTVTEFNNENYILVETASKAR